jgi:hypothetical protein
MDHGLKLSGCSKSHETTMGWGTSLFRHMLHVSFSRLQAPTRYSAEASETCFWKLNAMPSPIDYRMFLLLFPRQYPLHGETRDMVYNTYIDMHATRH